TFGKLIGIQTALLAMFLSVFSILSHQSNTESIILVNKANDQWSHYQSKRIRDYQLELNTQLLQLMAPANEQTTAAISDYSQQRRKYQTELAQIKEEADQIVKDGHREHHRTGYFELAEAFLEISTILTSLYFLSHKKLFPMLGLMVGLTGGIIGVLGLL